MRESDRLSLIREIEDKRGSRVITYITVDRWGLSSPILLEDVRVLERHIRLCLAGRAKKIDLFLYTSGGVAIAPWAMVSLFREFLGSRPFCVLIPARAYSAGTLISLGADEIVMGPAGNLGPIDIQMNLGGGRYIGVEDVRAYFKLAEDMGLKSQRDRLHLFSLLAESTHPVIVGDIYRAWSENERLAMLLLGSRKRPLSDKTNQEIAEFLLRRIGDHGQSIRRTEARRIGLSFVKDSEECGIDTQMTSLFDAYEDLLHLDVPYLNGVTWTDEEESGSADAPVALIETVERLDIAHLAQGARFWRKPEGAPAPQPAGEEVLAELKGEGRPKMSLEWQQLRAPDPRKDPPRR